VTAQRDAESGDAHGFAIAPKSAPPIWWRAGPKPARSKRNNLWKATSRICERQAILKHWPVQRRRDEIRGSPHSRRTLPRKLQQSREGNAADASSLGRITPISSAMTSALLSAFQPISSSSPDPVCRVKSKCQHRRRSLGGQPSSRRAPSPTCAWPQRTPTIDTSAQALGAKRKRAGLPLHSLSATARRDLGQWAAEKGPSRRLGSRHGHHRQRHHLVDYHPYLPVPGPKTCHPDQREGPATRSREL